MLVNKVINFINLNDNNFYVFVEN